MSNGLHADTRAIDSRGKATVTSAEDFGGEINSLGNQIDYLMSIWKGLSAEEFKKAYQEQAANLKKFQKLLEDLGAAISSGAGTLSRAEEENISAASRL